MNDRITAFLLMMLVPLAVAAGVALCYFGGDWLQSEARGVAKFLTGLIKGIAAVLVAVAFLVSMLITYLSILQGLRSRKRRRKEAELAH